MLQYNTTAFNVVHLMLIFTTPAMQNVAHHMLQLFFQNLLTTVLQLLPQLYFSVANFLSKVTAG